MDQFKNARIKLTAWYVLIIMLISLSFSGLIYRLVINEVQNRFSIIQHRIPVIGVHPNTKFQILLEDSQHIKNSLFNFLAYINLMILVFSSGAGYFLAGRTLEPIEKSLGDQKRFIADASHELKTPLASLQTAVEVALRDKKLTLKGAKEALTSNLSDIKRLNKLTHYLLNVARVESQESKKQIVHLNKLVSEVIDNFASKRKINSGLVKVKIYADPNEIKQLVSTIIDNAINYSEKEIFVNLAKNKSNAFLTIKDFGVGISKKDLPYIFERFYQGDKSRNKSKEGFGLGLALAKKLADKNNINISVKSEIGKGATFKLILKLA